MLQSTASTDTIIIEGGRTNWAYWTDLWRYRELWFILAWRDVTVRYKQTIIGVAWALIRPLITMLILVLVFGKIAKLPSGGVPYPLLVLPGMLAWQLFAAGLSSSSGSLVSNAGLISKVYFPRLIIPLSSLGVSVVDFLVTLPLLIVVMLWYGQGLTWHLLFLPAIVLVAVMVALGVGLWASAINVRYRDATVIIPFIMQFGLYLSPVAYSIDAVPEAYRTWYSLNPMVGVIEGFRWCLISQATGPTLLSMASTLIVTTVLLITGYRYFRSTERTFADII